MPALRANLALAHLEAIVDDEDELDIIPARLDAAEIGSVGSALVLGIAVRVARALEHARPVGGGRGGGLLLREHDRGEVPAHLVAEGERGGREREGNGRGGWCQRA